MMIELPALQLTDVQNMSVQGLRSELATSITMTAQAVARMAMIWRELEHRGEDLSDLRVGLASCLPLVANGMLLPEAVVRYAGRSTLLKHLCHIPAEQQRSLINGAKIPVVLNGNGTVANLSLDDLPNQQVRTVFSHQGIRSTDEQKQLQIARLAAHQNIGKRRGRKPNIQVFIERDVLQIGKTEVSLSALLDALQQAGLSISNSK